MTLHLLGHGGPDTVLVLVVDFFLFFSFFLLPFLSPFFLSLSFVSDFVCCLFLLCFAFCLDII